MTKSRSSGRSRGAAKGRSARTVNKSAITGWYVSNSSVRSDPKTTYRQSVGKKKG